MAEKVTAMVLEVDLQCSDCRKKIKKTLGKFPQIRDQVYDEKANTVTITVVCCSPEKIRDKLFSKGGKVIKSIEIKEPDEKEEAEKPKDSENPKEAKEKADAPKSVGATSAEKPEDASEAEPEKGPEPVLVSGVPSVFPYSGPSFDQHGAGPYYHGYGFPPPPPQPIYEGYYGYGYGGAGHVRRWDGHCFSDENPQGCFIM